MKKIMYLLFAVLVFGLVNCAVAGNTQCVNCVINGRATPPTSGMSSDFYHNQTYWSNLAGNSRNSQPAGGTGSDFYHNQTYSSQGSWSNQAGNNWYSHKSYRQQEPATSREASPAAKRMAMVNQKVKECNDAFAVEGKVEVLKDGVYSVTLAPAGESCNPQETGFDCKNPSFQDSLKRNFCQCLRECKKLEK